jgi:hypothetical protein
MEMKLPETYTQKMYLTVRPNGRLSLFDWKVRDNDEDGYVCLTETEITVDVPQEDPVPRVIECLRSAQQAVRAKAELQSQEIEEKIQSLLALPNPEAEENTDDLPF